MTDINATWYSVSWLPTWFLIPVVLPNSMFFSSSKRLGSIATNFCISQYALPEDNLKIYSAKYWVFVDKYHETGMSSLHNNSGISKLLQRCPMWPTTYILSQQHFHTTFGHKVHRPKTRKDNCFPKQSQWNSSNTKLSAKSIGKWHTNGEGSCFSNFSNRKQLNFLIVACSCWDVYALVQPNSMCH